MVHAPPPFRPDRPAEAQLAAGAVLASDGAPPAIFLLHERSEDRWCLPKGHVERGESVQVAALREIAEETGFLDVRLGPELATLTYRFYDAARDRSIVKSSVYFLGRCPRLPPTLESGFDAGEWLPGPEALARISYPLDREVIESALRTLASETEH